MKTAVINRIRDHGRGSCFCVRDFWDIGKLTTISTNLARLEKSNFLQRLMPGIYYYPKFSKDKIVSANEKEVVRAISRSLGARAFLSGENTAYNLGLYDQEPEKVTYVINRRGETPFERKYYDNVIHFSKTRMTTLHDTTEEIMSMIYALLFLGKDHVKHHYNAIMDKLVKIVDNGENRKCINNVYIYNRFPIWLQNVLRDLLYV